MPEGTIKKLVSQKGFGFIRSADGAEEYFFHRSNVAKEYQFTNMREGQAVHFDLRPSRKKHGKMEAANVMLTETTTNNSASSTSRQHTNQVKSRQPVHDDAVSSLLPYGFVPIDPAHSVMDAPVLHDGSSGGELLSGEILCTLEALTPLLPGNLRYPIRKEGKDDREALVDMARLKKWGFEDVKPGKQIVEPLRLPDGRVVIAGSALKGMVRHSLGALLSAPMERVGEHHFSYRPNLDFNAPHTKEKYVFRPALIAAAINGGWKINVFDDVRSVLFVRKEVESVIKNASTNGVVTGDVQGIEQHKIKRKDKAPRITQHLISSNGSMHLNHRLAAYKGGIDGEGLLAAAFNNKNGGRGEFTYDHALVPLTCSCKLDLTADLYQHYLADQENVISNNKTGHLTAHPLEINHDQVAASIKTHSEFSVGQIIYVELTTDETGKVTTQSKVVSCGHPFRYRWAYTSSVRNKNRKPRECLVPNALELEATATGVPKRLTGARLLFGYVHNEDNRIGKGVYERMAGRISINHAVSNHNPEFLGEKERGYCVPLKILGTPKPSAWEFYLQQPQEKKQAPATYGDLPGDAGGELAGRKFYRHQTSVALSDITPRNDDTETKNSEKATLARFICAQGTKFNFTIRFARLREWELGALLAILQPDRLASAGKPKRYAHKLGLGRPLGMGSVQIHLDHFHARMEEETQFLPDNKRDVLLDKAGKALSLMLAGINIQDWLASHEFADRGRLGYPNKETKVDGKLNKTIYAWHTMVRREYSKLRREKAAAWSKLNSKIQIKTRNSVDD